METDQENPDQENPDEQGGDQSPVRSYECNFCKRGFSNAQALGGHMNIHRKDKAKLKHSSTSSTTETQQHQHQNQQQSLDIPRISPSFVPPILASKPQPLVVVEAKSSQLFDTSSSITWPWILGSSIESRDDVTERDQVQQLSLFVDEPSRIKDQENPRNQLLHGNAELDLELRLGPEPQESSSTPKRTKKFF